MSLHADFDTQLPDLPLLFDLEGIAHLFETRWPAPGVAPLAITSCKIQDVKYRPRTRCVVTYLLGGDLPDGERRQTIGVVEIRPEGTWHRLYDQDPLLPWLTSAADPGIVQERMPASIPPGVRVEGCQVTPVRYKPGLRCVFRYDLFLDTGAQVYFGKLLVEGVRELATTLHALQEVSKQTPGMAKIQPVEAAWDDLRVLVQPAVMGGTELNDAAFDSSVDTASRLKWICEAGSCLAVLHSCPEIEGPPRSLRDDVEELREYTVAIEQADQGLAELFTEAAVRVESRAAGRDEGQGVASHGAFRTDQFMIEDGRLVMIDLDSFCRANPARDAANFLAYLDWKELRRPEQVDLIDSTRRAFLDGYARAGGSLDPLWLDVYRAASLLKIAGRRYRSLSFKEWPMVPGLVERAAAVLK